jgi:anti-sigma factor RsiW
VQDAEYPGDERLSAWLDGELDEAECQRVQAWLAAHPEDAARVRLWAADRDALRSRLDAELEEAPAAAWRARVLGDDRRPVGWPAPRWLAAAAVLALASGLAGGWGGAWWVRQHAAGDTLAAAASTWPRFAAAAHAVYVPERRHPVEVAVEGDAAAQRAQEEHLSRWLTHRLDVPVKTFDLRAQGFRLVGGRLLPGGDGPCAQLMYEDAAGVRVTVYLRRQGTPAPAAFRYEVVNGLGLFTWVDGPAGYALVGPLPREYLLALAEAIAHQEP